MKKILTLCIGLLALLSARAEMSKIAYGECLPESKICVTRQVLDRSEKKIHLAIDFSLDSTYLKNMTWVSLRPVVVARDSAHQTGDSVTTMVKKLHAALIAGRQQMIVFAREGVEDRYGENYELVDRKVRRHADQLLCWEETFDYEPWMEHADVFVELENCGCGKFNAADTLPLRPVADPQPRLLAELIEPRHEIERADTIKEYDLRGTAFINFYVDKWDVVPTYMFNHRELKKITDTLDIMVADKNITVRSIQIHGWASPESPYEHNKMLSENRAKALTDYIHMLYHLPSEVYLPARATPENWIGLVDYLEHFPHELKHAAEIRAMIGDPAQVTGKAADALEWRIKKTYPQDYAHMLNSWYPHLRRSDYEVIFDVKQFTLAEARSVIKVHPYQLSLHEMMMVAESYGQWTEEYNKVVKLAYEFYGDDHEEACVNMANVCIREANYQLAESALAKAGDGAAACNARGVLALCRKDWAGARQAFLHAQEQGADVSFNLRLVDELEEHPSNK